jgi:hypothetical protein
LAVIQIEVVLLARPSVASALVPAVLFLGADRRHDACWLLALRMQTPVPALPACSSRRQSRPGAPGGTSRIGARHVWQRSFTQLWNCEAIARTTMG